MQEVQGWETATDGLWRVSSPGQLYLSRTWELWLQINLLALITRAAGRAANCELQRGNQKSQASYDPTADRDTSQKGDRVRTVPLTGPPEAGSLHHQDRVNLRLASNCGINLTDWIRFQIYNCSYRSVTPAVKSSLRYRDIQHTELGMRLNMLSRIETVSLCPLRPTADSVWKCQHKTSLSVSKLVSSLSSTLLEFCPNKNGNWM